MKANIPKGMGGGPGNMQAMLRQAQKMQDEAQRVQAELEETEYSATAGGGAVSATVNGTHDLIALTISPDVVDPDDAEMLADLVMAAINEANRNATKDSEAKMGAVTGGMENAACFENRGHLVQELKRIARAGDTLLFKGSHGMHMEIALERFLADET